jgi:hypothetical protein
MLLRIVFIYTGLRVRSLADKLFLILRVRVWVKGQFIGVIVKIVSIIIINNIFLLSLLRKTVLLAFFEGHVVV